MRLAIYLIGGFLTSMVGWQMHHSVPWTIVDFIFWIFAWLKWIICQEITLTILKKAFAWFLM